MTRVGQGAAEGHSRGTTGTFPGAGHTWSSCSSEAGQLRRGEAGWGRALATIPFSSSCPSTRRAGPLPNKAQLSLRFLGSPAESSCARPFPSARGTKNNQEPEQTLSVPAGHKPFAPSGGSASGRHRGTSPESDCWGKGNSAPIPDHTHSHHWVLQAGTSEEQPVLLRHPFPPLHPPEEAAEERELWEGDVIKGCGAEGWKPQKPAGRDILPAAAVPRQIYTPGGSCPHPKRAQLPQTFRGTSQACPGRCCGFAFPSRTPTSHPGRKGMTLPVGSSSSRVKLHY